MRAAGGDFGGRGETGIGGLVIGELVEAGGGNEEDVGVFGAGDVAVIFIAPEQAARGGAGRGVEARLEKAGGAGGFVFAAEGEGFGGVETAVVVFFVDGLDALDAE